MSGEQHDALKRLEDAIEEYGKAERSAGIMGGVAGADVAMERRDTVMEIAREIIYEGEAEHV